MYHVFTPVLINPGVIVEDWPVPVIVTVKLFWPELFPSQLAAAFAGEGGLPTPNKLITTAKIIPAKMSVHLSLVEREKAENLDMIVSPVVEFKLL
ncbi:MAG: hypothetical protein WA821_11070 [Anaerolineales bacterium]